MDWFWSGWLGYSTTKTTHTTSTATPKYTGSQSTITGSSHGSTRTSTLSLPTNAVAPSGEVESGNDEVQLSAVIVPVVVSALVIVLVIVVFVAYRRGLFGSVFPLCSRNHSSKGTTEDTPGTDVSYEDLRREACNDFVLYRELNSV